MLGFRVEKEELVSVSDGVALTYEYELSDSSACLSSSSAIRLLNSCFTYWASSSLGVRSAVVRLAS